jgi:hypothetical protein
MHLGQKFKVHRDEIIKRVQELTGVDVNSVGTEVDTIKAIDALLHIKDKGMREPFDSND